MVLNQSQIAIDAIETTTLASWSALNVPILYSQPTMDPHAGSKTATRVKRPTDSGVLNATEDSG